MVIQSVRIISCGWEVVKYIIEKGRKLLRDAYSALWIWGVVGGWYLKYLTMVGVTKLAKVVYVYA